MTPDDDAFIRKIVDSPGDDLPRLVYADWLDERDDPRGAYLRAELEWAKPWRDGNLPNDASAVQALAVGLDALWVARVSRPPVGVCWDAVKAFADGEATTGYDLDVASSHLSMKLPAELRGLLLNYNLSRVQYRFAWPAMKRTIRLSISGFVCLVDPDYDEEVLSRELVDRTWCARDDFLPPKYVFLAETDCDGSYFVVSVRGKVHLASDEFLHLGPKRGLKAVADSIGWFLCGLEPNTAGQHSPIASDYTGQDT